MGFRSIKGALNGGYEISAARFCDYKDGDKKN